MVGERNSGRMKALSAGRGEAKKLAYSNQAGRRLASSGWSHHHHRPGPRLQRPSHEKRSAVSLCTFHASSPTLRGPAANARPSEQAACGEPGYKSINPLHRLDARGRRWAAGCPKSTKKARALGQNWLAGRPYVAGGTAAASTNLSIPA
ncbi:hypothetical protein L1887_53236 [Cichorium endivia]|nr:hypothetical protein L1887_53236 [Cichorium endivia]